MPIRPIVLYPDTRLKTLCTAVSEFNQSVQDALADLLDTMNAAPPRTVGIAAPQIGIMQRVAFVDTSRNPKYPAGHGPLALVNPRVVAHSEQQLFREGCLSIPDYTANIQRHLHITVTALMPDGSEITFDAEGFEAVVLQHEIDHLDGLLFLDRIVNTKTDLFARKERRP